MGMTMAEKILAAHSKRDKISPGDIVTCNLDWAVVHDIFFSVDGNFDFKNVLKIDHPEKSVVLFDHAVPAPTAKDAAGMVAARQFVVKHGIKNFYDVGNHGVIHQLLAEEGYARPGALIACGDSHTCAAGAFNCAARGLGPADLVYIMCKGENWYSVSPTLLYRLSGALPERVMGKDLFLYIAGVFGDATNLNVEFGGEGVTALPIHERQSIATMCAEINAEFVVFPCDERLRMHLAAHGIMEYEAVAPDDDAAYEAIHEIDLSALEPYMALPHSIPGNCVPLKKQSGLKVQQALLGSCSNGRLEDLAIAAEMIKGKKVASGVRFIVTPASQKIYLEALRAGYLETLTEAGAVVTNSSCGACYGGHLGLLGPGERCLSTTTRNFKGRMGSADAEIMLASPASVTASAITGVVTDPRTI